MCLSLIVFCLSPILVFCIYLYPLLLSVFCLCIRSILSICILYSYLYFACVSAVHIIYLYPLLLAVFRLCIRSLYHHSVSLLYCLCVSILYPLSISSPLYSTASACIPTLTLHLNVKSFITAHIIIQYYSADLPPLRPALW